MATIHAVVVFILWVLAMYASPQNFIPESVWFVFFSFLKMFQACNQEREPLPWDSADQSHDTDNEQQVMIRWSKQFANTDSWSKNYVMSTSKQLKHVKRLKSSFQTIF